MTGGEAAPVTPGATTLWELRQYVLAPGTRERFDDRVRTTTTPIFNRIGMPFDRFWASHEDPLTVYYLLCWTSEQEMEDTWARLAADPEWRAARAGYESPVLESTVTLLNPLNRSRSERPHHERRTS